MKFIKTAVALLTTVLGLALPAAANAAGETLDAFFSLKPQSGQFLKSGFKPANWEIGNTVQALGDPKPAVILPSKVINLQFPADAMTFNPGNMPVCGLDKVGPPPVSLSAPVETIVARCPDAVIGNGTAKFVLNRNNLNPNAVLKGQIVAFNGGLTTGTPTPGFPAWPAGSPLLRIYAYSYDTGVAIYTEAAYVDGNLTFNVPSLTQDSSVSELNLAIPSTQKTLTNLGPGQVTAVLPKGKKSDYVKGQCATGEWPWSATFTHGTRDTGGNPTSPDTFSNDSGVETCTGVVGKATIGSVKVTGPSKVMRGKPVVYKVAIRNSGALAATGVRLRVGGRGIAVNSSVGQIAPGATRTVSVRAPFRSKGKIRASFRVTSNNAGSKTVNRTITVR